MVSRREARIAELEAKISEYHKVLEGLPPGDAREGVAHLCRGLHARVRRLRTEVCALQVAELGEDPRQLKVPGTERANVKKKTR